MRYVVTLYTRKWRMIQAVFYFPSTADGLKKAREKRAELMAKYLDNDITLEKFNE